MSAPEFDDKLIDRIRKGFGGLPSQQQIDRKRSRAGRDALDIRKFLLDRRDFLAASAGGIAAAMLPGCGGSGSRSGALEEEPCDPVATATPTELRVGTELFQDSVYAQPVVAGNAPHSHTIVEGARSRLRVQSDVLSDDPQESAFLDTGYHHGLPELIQIEDDPETGDPMIVHYRHPTGARTDGARTDGLVRDVIMTKADELDNPTSLVAVTGSFTNKFGPDTGGGTSQDFAYMVFVEDRNSFRVGHLLVGYGQIAKGSPTGEPSAFRQWTIEHVTHPFLDVNSAADYVGWTKYTSAAWVSPQSNAAPTYQAEQNVEHIVINLTAGSSPAFLILTLMDGHGIAPEVTASRVAVPDSPYPLQLAHIDWDPTATNYRRLTNLAVITSRPHSTEGWNYYVYGLRTPTGAVTTIPFGENVRYNFLNLQGAWELKELEFTGSETEQGTYKIDYRELKDVHTLHTTHVDDTLYHVKLGRVADGAPVLFIIGQDGGGFFQAGQFQLTLPDDAGLGKLTTLSGGTSRFGGYRYVLSDTDGNVFLMRQRRSLSVESPYAPPIYGINDADGQPRTTWTGVHDPLPAETASSSNLHQLNKWVNTSTDRTQLPVYNLLLDAALAFGTDTSSVSQGVWLGNTFVAAFAARHMTSDSEHIAITQATNTDSGELEYRALAVFKNPVDKTWRQRQIATQVLPKPPGLQESGDHYQATVSLTNSSGQAVPLQSGDGADLWIEVRADSPCTVIDDTSNLFYDVDRYTSFFARPSPATAKLVLLVKAENLAQMLYFRLMQAGSLQTSPNDPAMLNGAVPTTPWLAVNVAQQAQERMSATGSNGASTPDDGVYVSGTTLSENNANENWQTKGNFTASQDTFDSIAAYLNTSGQNLIDNSGELGLGASECVDPLTAVTGYAPPAAASQPTITTHYDYLGGMVTVTQSAPSSGGPPLGGLFSSVSHTLHDALHCLQHADDAFYNKLGSDGVVLKSSIDGIKVTIAADIMKAVNGMNMVLEEAVTTIEEYGSIVLNVLVTYVKTTFIYQYIDLIISLISLFLHLQDIRDLFHSLSDYVDDLFSSSADPSIPLPPGDYKTATAINQYVGPNTQLMSAFAMNGEQSTQVPNEIVENVLSAVLANPIAGQLLNKIQSELGKAIDAVAGELPIEFPVADDLVEDIAQELRDLVEVVVDGVADLSEDAIKDLIDAVAASIADPLGIMQSLQTGLTNVFKDFDSDVLEPLYEFVDGLVTQAPTIAHDVLEQDQAFVINLKSIADLCSLLKIGTTGPSNVTLSGKEALLFPMTVILWVAVYEVEKKSIKSIDELMQPASTTAGPLGGSQVTRWDYARLGIGLIVKLLGGAAWGLTTQTSGVTNGVKTFATFSGALGVGRWIVELIYAVKFFDPDKPSPFVATWRMVSASANVTFSAASFLLLRPLSKLNVGEGWNEFSPRPSDICQLIQFFVTGTDMGIDTTLVLAQIPSASAQDLVNVGGQDMQRSQLVVQTVFNMFQPQLEDQIEIVGGLVLGTPFGFVVQFLAKTDL